ncbi:MAG TPA: permease-like cell division protein FtsX [Saprospiraceae bacterium]|nr:permease-like cell division protein FtsX [Saprospiraceae bacterium]HMQ84255.1 permease-like cell division protein FtsX [Saprospiraceae bacterium]
MAEMNPSVGKTKPNYWYAIISVALVLFLLGLFGMAVLDARLLIQEMKENVNLILELKPDVQREEVQALRQTLEKSKYIKAESLEYVSKERGADMMREEFGEDFLKLDMPNPLYDVFTFNVRAVYMQQDSLKALKASLKELDSVNDVYYQESLVNKIVENLESMSWIIIGIALFFILVALVLIHNTVRLALYANRFLIKNMELVGASWSFISKPYLLKGLGHGLLSGLMAALALFLLNNWLQKQIPGIGQQHSWLDFGLLLLALLLLGLFINTLSTYYVVRKYLKMREDDLY